jgi:hypothetical protein
MKRSAFRARPKRRIGWVIFATLGLVWTACAAAQPAGEGVITDKLKRQINVMETIIGEVLVDSENLTVSGLDPVRGIYLDGYGAVFTCETSTTGGAFFFGENIVIPELPDMPEVGRALRGFRVETDDDGHITIIRRGENEDEDEDEDEEIDDENESEEEDEDESGDVDEDDDEDEYWDEDQGAEDEGDDESGRPRVIARDRESWTKWQDERKARKLENLEAGREELIDVLVDYGDTMTRLADTEWVVIAAFFPERESSRDQDQDVSRLVIRARVSDLRAFGQERISRDAMLARVVKEEY